MSEYGQALRVFVAGCPSGTADAQVLMNRILNVAEDYEKLEALNKQLLDACKESKNALNRCVRFLLGTGQQPTPEEMGEAVLIIDAAIEATEREQ